MAKKNHLSQSDFHTSADGQNGEQHVAAPDQMQASNEALLSLFDCLEDGVLVMDQDGIVLAVNQTLTKLVGSTPAASEGKPWTALRLDGTHLRELVQQAYTMQRPQQGREQHIGPDDQSHILDIRVTPVMNEHHQIERVILHVVDVTERLELEAMLIQSERRAATAKLSATIAHEVNTPLQAIQSALYLARRTSTSQSAHHLEKADRQVRRIHTILNRLLILHRVGENPPELVDINAIIKHLLDLLRTTLQDQGIEERIHLAADIPSFWGKTDDLHQALLNLLLNAIDAMPRGGVLTIRSWQTNTPQTAPHTSPSLVIAISDTGDGIPPEIQSRIFDPFFTTRPDGAGVGLAISRKIMSNHGGQISVRSAPGKGSTFTCTLPITAS